MQSFHQHEDASLALWALFLQLFIFSAQRTVASGRCSCGGGGGKIIINKTYNSFPMAMATFTGIPNMHLYLIVYSSFIGPQDGVKMKTDWKKKVLLSQSINE